MADFDWIPALAGGALFGLAATLLLGGSGRIAGISGGKRPRLSALRR